jgi:tetratricopeptide (TPR) repeat protein
MSDGNTSNNGLGTFLTQMSAIILAVISFISGVYGFIKLFADKDAGLVTWISLAVGILLLLGICLYYAVFWQLERQDQGQPAFSPLSDEQVQAQAKKARHRQRMRRLALAGLILIPILSVSGVIGWFYVQSLPAKNIIVLVADFDGPDEKTNGVTTTVFKRLKQATERYADVEIQRLNKPITEEEGSKVAKAEGEKRKAAIVIWGWYLSPGEQVPLSVNFEVLHPSKDFFELGQNARGNIQTAPIADLTHFILQPRLSTEMTYLSLFTMGMARRAAEDWDGAILRFSDALDQKIEPSSSLDQSLVYFYRGFSYLSQNNLDRALDDLNQAIKRQPTLAEAYANRVNIYLAKGDYSHALADANQALKLMPGFAMTYNNRGLIYLKTGDYDRAIADFNQTLKLLPPAKDTPSVTRTNGSQLGTFKISDHEFPTANFVFTELSDSLVYINRGDAYLSKGDYDHALADFNQAIKLQPDSAMAYANRASVYFVKQDFDLVLADLNQTIKLQPDWDLAYMKRGSAYYMKGDTDHALADINLAIKLQPNSALFYGTRGEVYAKRDDHDRAIADYSQAIKLQPDLISIYLERSRSYRKKGDDDRAFADYNQVLKLAPDNAEAYNARGWTYAEKGDFDHALADLNQALKLKPDEANFYDSRGFAYAGKGDNNRAIADYNHALKLKPDADYAYYHRGIVYRVLGDHQKAAADFKKTLELTSNAKKRQDAEKQLQELGAR